MDRKAGVLMHISSLPSNYGIGTLGAEAYHFIEPKYITDWLTGSLYEKLDGKINDSFLDKGVLHLMMERGMGKTSFAYALDSQYDDSGHIKLRDTVVRVFYCSRVQLRSVQVFADGIHNELRRGIGFFEKISGNPYRIESRQPSSAGAGRARRGSAGVRGNL